MTVSDRSTAVWEYSSTIPNSNQLSSLTSHISLYGGNNEEPITNMNNSSNYSLLNAYLSEKDNLMMSNTSNKENGFPSTGTSTLTTNNNNNNPNGNISSSLYHTGLGGIGDFRRVMTFKSSNNECVYTTSNVMLASFDTVGHFPSNSTGIRYGGMIEKENSWIYANSSGTRAQHALYCLSGHRLYTGLLPSYEISNNRDRLNITNFNSPKDMFADGEELKLGLNHIIDRKSSKLSRSKMQVTSAVLLPLRRLLLLGTEDGLVRVVS